MSTFLGLTVSCSTIVFSINMDADVEIEAAGSADDTPSRLVAYRGMLRSDPGPAGFAHDILEFIDRHIPTREAANELQQWWEKQGAGEIFTVVSSTGMWEVRTIVDLQNALSQAPVRHTACEPQQRSPKGEDIGFMDDVGDGKPVPFHRRSCSSGPDGSPPRIILIVQFDSFDRAGLLALFGPLLCLDDLDFYQFVRQNPSDFFERHDMLLLPFQEQSGGKGGRSGLIAGLRCKRRTLPHTSQELIPEYTICFIRGKRLYGRFVNHVKSMLKPTDPSLHGDDDVYLLSRAWLRLFSQEILRMPKPGLDEQQKWTYSELFEAKETPEWHLPVFELKLVRTQIRGWLQGEARRNGLLLREVSSGSSLQGQEFVEEYSLALEEAQLLYEGMTQFMTSQSVEASLLSIKESQRGIEEAHAVMYLTQLAFVFLPLTFVTGVFGMNVKPFNEGASVSQFAITAGAVAGTAFVFGLWTERKTMRSIVRRAYRDIPIITYRLMVWFLFLFWAIVAIWTLGFWTLTWPIDIIKKVLRYQGRLGYGPA
jgi:hypothetical protein